MLQFLVRSNADVSTRTSVYKPISLFFFVNWFRLFIFCVRVSVNANLNPDSLLTFVFADFILMNVKKTTDMNVLLFFRASSCACTSLFPKLWAATEETVTLALCRGRKISSRTPGKLDSNGRIFALYYCRIPWLFTKISVGNLFFTSSN